MLDKYKGFFKGGLRHGYGTYNYHDGGVYEGHFEKDIKNGDEKYTLDGEVVKGI